MAEKTICSIFKKKCRVSSEERYHMIVEAAAPLFAKNGFSGTTTKEIAKASGVSEALLYRHFSSKEELYKEMQVQTCGSDNQNVSRLMNLPSNTDTLIVSVYYFFLHIFLNEKPDIDPEQTKKRLMVHSLLEDGKFAKSFLGIFMEPIIKKFSECIKEGIKAGDIVKGVTPGDLGSWFGHHLIVMLSLYQLPKTEIIDYKYPKNEILIHAVRFTLRGLGLKDKILETKVTAEALAVRFAQLK